MKLVLHGALKKKYGDSVEIKTNIVADAIEGFSRQAKNWPRDMLVEVVGFDTPEKLSAPTAVAEVHLIPAFQGGGPVGKILVGIALIGISFIPGIGQVVDTMLISMGAGLILGGIMQLFTKTPTQQNSSQYLAGNTNTTAIGTPITMAWGRVKFAPHWLSIVVDSNQLVLGTFPASPT